MATTLPTNLATDCQRQNRLKFVALGGIWLDEICAPGKEPLVDVPGGSVAFGKNGSTYIEETCQD
jgi:hypothetical protein